MRSKHCCKGAVWYNYLARSVLNVFVSDNVHARVPRNSRARRLRGHFAVYLFILFRSNRFRFYGRWWNVQNVCVIRHRYAAQRSLEPDKWQHTNTSLGVPPDRQWRTRPMPRRSHWRACEKIQNRSFWIFKTNTETTNGVCIKLFFCGPFDVFGLRFEWVTDFGWSPIWKGADKINRCIRWTIPCETRFTIYSVIQ